jgi:hypothetical protein
VDRNQVKSWAYTFRDYLSGSANPPSGQPRQFTDEDLFVLMHAVMHWEPNPDIENIRTSLNHEEHMENDLYVRTLREHTPILQDAPDWLDKVWTHGVFLNGGGVDEYLTLARSYRHTADTLLEAALKSNEPRDWAYPVLYAYRHTLELYLKMIGHVQERTHSLKRCIELVERHLGKRIGTPMRGSVTVIPQVRERSFSILNRAAPAHKRREYWVQ